MTHPLKYLLRRAGVRRSTFAAARMCCERNLFAALPRRPLGRRARILCYHSVGTPEWGVNDVSPARFRRHLELALHAGYRFVPAEHIASTGGQPGDLAITFDDGLTSVATNAAPVLRELGIPWTLFVVSEWAEGRHSFADDVFLDWNAIERLAAEGATIGSHSATHPNFAHLGREAAVHELGRSRETIEARTGIAATTFAIPFGQSTNWTHGLSDLAAQAGYETVYAQSEQHRPPGTTGRTFVTRFDTERVFRAALAGAFVGWEEWL